MLSSDDFQAMQVVQVASMMDRCVVLKPGTVQDTAGQVMPMYTESAPLPCGVEAAGSVKSLLSFMTVISWDVRLRLPLSAAVDAGDRIRITHRLGAVLKEPEVYEISAPPRRGPTASIVELRRIRV